MKILHVTGMPYPTKLGGFEKWLIAAGKCAKDHGDELFISYYESIGNVPPYLKQICENGIQIILLKSDNDICDFCLTKGIEIVHFHFGFEGYRKIFSALKKNGIKEYLHLHCECYYFTSKEWKKKLLTRCRIFCHRLKTHFCQRYFTAILPCSDTVRKEYLQFYKWSSKRCQTLYLGISEYKYPEKDYRKNKIPSIICIAFHSPIKGVDVLLRSIAILHQKHISFTCMMIGGGNSESDGEDTARLLKLSKELKLDSIVTWVGITNNASRYLADGDVYCQPSRTEALSLSIAEAMQAGLPIVASNVGGIHELVHNNENGFLCKPDDPETLAMLLEQLLIDPSLRESMGEKSKEILADLNFTTSKSVNKLWELYCK